MVLMGSACGRGEETIEHLNAQGEKLGLLKVRLYRPFAAEAFLAALPKHGQVDRGTGPHQGAGRVGEPLYQDVVTAFSERSPSGGTAPFAPAGIIGGRYGLSSKEFTPAMVKGVFDELKKPAPEEPLHHRHRRRRDPYQPGVRSGVLDRRPGTVRALFYGLGSDGTVGANKNSIKIIGSRRRQLRAGLFRLRLEEVRLDDGFASALWPGPDPLDLPHQQGELRRLPSVRVPGAHRRPGRGGCRAPLPAERPVRAG
jgi:pyruvate-ferredoxin/flavodoxin oxidoreductase